MARALLAEMPFLLSAAVGAANGGAVSRGTSAGPGPPAIGVQSGPRSSEVESVNRIGTVWAFHPYKATWSMHDGKGTSHGIGIVDDFWSRLPGGTNGGYVVWFTEAGSRVDRGSAIYKRHTQSQGSAETLQRRETEFLFDRLGARGRGAKRIHYYHYWENLCPPTFPCGRWDSGLIRPGGTAPDPGGRRPVYFELKQHSNP